MGGVVGGILALLAAIVLLIFLRRRKAKAAISEDGTDSNKTDMNHKPELVGLPYDNNTIGTAGTTFADRSSVQRREQEGDGGAKPDLWGDMVMQREPDESVGNRNSVNRRE